MTEATVTFPNGRTATVTGPNREAVLARIEVLKAENQKPEGNTISGLFDAARAVGSNLAGSIVGSLEGINEASDTLTAFDELRGERVLPRHERAANTLEERREKMSIQPSTQAGERFIGKLAKGAEVVSGVGRNAIANLIDARAGRNIEFGNRIRDEGVSETLGDTTFEATGSPLLATAAETLPEAAALVLGSKGLGRAKVPDTRKPDVPPITNKPEVSVGKPKLDEVVDLTPNADQIVARLKKGKPEGVAEAVVPDVETIKSAQRLGVDLNPEHYSTNRAFQDVARALKSQPGSKLEANERRALDELGNSADELVERMGGSVDKAAVSDDILSDTKSTIANLQDEANKAYDVVRQTIPAQTRVDVSRIKEYLDTKIAEFGGDKTLLNTVEKRLLALTKKEATPTYAALDRIRRDVGDGFNKRKGPFSDDNDATLREVYGVLSDTQNGVAESFGIGELYASARGAVAKRKNIEDNAVQLFGRDLSGSLTQKIRSASTALAKGDVSRLNRLLNALPDSRRQEVVATIVGDLFSGGSRRGGQLGQGFVGTFEALNRNKAARNALFQHLPAHSRKRFNDIGRVLTGIVRSNQKPLGNPSGSAGPIIKAMEDGSALSRIYSASKKVAAAEGVSTSVGLPGAGAAGTIGAILAKQRTPVIQAADELLSSPSFSRAVNEAIKGNTKRSDSIVQNSPEFKKWATTISPEDARAISTIGFVAWLSQQ